MHFFASVICLFLAIEICSTKQDYELIAAHVVHRHGDRNIHSTYPKDPYKSERYWPGGLGALTDLGKQQTYKLGQYLQRKYYQLIGDTYSDKKMYYRSTDRSRTIKSARSCAAGLYPRSRLPKIDVVSTKDDYLLYAGAKCARFQKLLNEHLESRKLKDIWKRYRSTIRLIERNTGKRLQSFADIATIYDILYVENLKNFPLPKWAKETPGLRQILEYLVGVHLKSFTYTTELKKLKAGYLIDKILQHFYKKIDSTLHPDRNLWIYSAHDVTLAILLNALDMFDSKVPPYASSLHFELYKSGRDYYVQIIYRKPDTDHNPRPLYIRNCGTMCPLDKFFDLYRHILPRKNESFASACKIRK